MTEGTEEPLADSRNVPALLTALRTRQRSCTVVVTGTPGGSIHVRDGLVVAMETPGAPGIEALLLRSGRIGGIHSALDRAKAVAGDGNVDIAGGASTVRQYLAEALIDELQLHVVPTLLGAGLRLFDGPAAGPQRVEQVRVVETPTATHLKYRFVK
ncbi:dihydrofolate reductase family protein [Streptomyces sp. NPDC048504]|uniref:dihydrofolate reductase family protein n=1 Tax=Streptomyces sp. NPDC048504 TaxID=3365559 RepID=UPI00371E59BC